MPPPLALLLGYCLVAFLIRLDMRWRTAESNGIIVAAVFLGVIGSRPLSLWLGSGGGPSGEGNPINSIFFGLIIVISAAVLQARRLHWGTILTNNKALVALYLFLAVSSVWSVDAGTALKRLVKDFACVLVALMVLTERDPAAAFRLIAVRVSYVLFPLSLVFGKYYPSIGRNFSIGGEPMFTGVTTQKNSLGEIVFVLGLILLWDISELLKRDVWNTNRPQIVARIGILALGVWLLVACDSKTSLLCLIVAVSLFLVRGRLRRRHNGRRILIICLVLGASLAAFDKSLGISTFVLKALNRDASLTGRTEIWKVVLQQNTDPLIGDGFYLFWDGEGGRAVARELAGVKSAHNGYIETYVDGGIIGCALLGLLLLAVGKRVIAGYFSNAPFSPIGVSFWVTAVIYNTSESSFFRLDPLWFTLVLVGIGSARQVSGELSALEVEMDGSGPHETYAVPMPRPATGGGTRELAHQPRDSPISARPAESLARSRERAPVRNGRIASV